MKKKFDNRQKCQAKLSEKYDRYANQGEKVLICTRLARYKLYNTYYCSEHASLRLLDDAKIEKKIEVL